LTVSKINQRKAVISSSVKQANSKPDDEKQIELSETRARWALAIIKRADIALHRAFEAHGLDRREKSHWKPLVLYLSLELYGGRGAGRPRQNPKKRNAFDDQIASQIDSLMAQCESRLAACRTLHTRNSQDPRYGVERLRKCDLRARKRRVAAEKGN
jgi:hypothetical protein